MWSTLLKADPTSLAPPARLRRRVRASIDPHHLDRGIGALAHLLASSPAARVPLLHRGLLEAGVLASDPESWKDPPHLAALCWGAGRVRAPAPSAPSGVTGPWPQEPVIDPDFYAPVLSLDAQDRGEHRRYIVARYLGQIVHLAPRAAVRVLRGPRLSPIDDATFISHLTQTSLGQFVSFDLEARDRALFAAVMEEAGPGPYAKLDFSFAPTEHLLPGLHVAPTIVLARREIGDRYRAVAISVGERVVRPGDGSAWELARYFALQGSHTRLVNVAHPRLHFPSDVINAITRSMLPPSHIVHRLLSPHLRFALGLDEAVIYHRRSVLHNSQRELYTPFPVTSQGMLARAIAGRLGVPGLASYGPYRFGDGLLGDHVPYGRFRREWFELYHAFASRVCSLIAGDDPHIRSWADHIRAWVPGFPSGNEILHGGNLPRALASYICAVSVYHSGDHASYAAIPPAQIPWRLRTPPPDGKPTPKLDLDALVSPEDHFRHLLCHAMFFAPVVIHSLREVDYAIDSARAQEAVERLIAGMDAIDARWAGSSFPQSARIACSIQY